MATSAKVRNWVARWRQQMVQRGSLEQASLDELESHLWDTIEQLVEEGLSEREAFLQACMRLGHEDALIEEYDKVSYWSDEKRSWWDHAFWMPAMFANYLKIALRTLRKYKGYTFINVTGLAVGMAACLVILFYVQDELSYDTYHEHAEQVYRVTQEQFDNEGTSSLHEIMLDPPIAPLLKADFPEVTHAARLTPVGPLLSYEDKHIDSGHCYWADPEVFDIFSIPFLQGNPQSALVEPFTLALSTSKATALFGDEDPLGKTVIVNGDEAFTVTGLFEDLPSNTHLPIDVLGSMATLERWFGELRWDSPNYVTYVRLAEDVNAKQLAQKFPAFFESHRGAEAARLNKLYLQPLTDIHLHSHLVGEIVPNGDIRYVYLLSAVALFILFIACINFMNLSTARSVRRAKEVGLRKVVGARRGELIQQFLGESTVLTFLSLVLSVVLVGVALPFFNDFTGKALSFQVEDLVFYLALFLGVGLTVGIAAGSYPAFYLSAFRPMAVLKSGDGQEKGRSAFRASLVVVQFVIAIVLLMGTVVVYQQLAFINQQKLGFDKEHTLILPTVWDIKEDFDPFREQLLRHPDVINVAQSNPVPSRRLPFSYESSTAQENTNQLTTASLYAVFADDSFFPTYQIAFAAGRNFSDELASDTDTGFILNETAAEKLGWVSASEAIDKPLTVGGWRGSVIGVVEDFHFESLHQEIAPMVFYMDPRNYRQVSIKIPAEADLPGLIDFLEERWQQYEPNSPLYYSFLDQHFDKVYEAEQKLGQMFGMFAFLAILITCLGLFGMTAFTVERRTKEIGIRKALGASVSGVVALLSRDALKLVGLAFLIAMPVAVFAMQRWLENFAYHATLSWWMLALVGVAALLLALGTVSFQSIRAARVNPVKSLRHE